MQWKGKYRLQFSADLTEKEVPWLFFSENAYDCTPSVCNRPCPTVPNCSQETEKASKPS